jgi:recombination protein RecT
MTDQNTIQKVSNVKELCKSDFFRQQVEEALPGGMTLMRWMRCFATQCQKNSKLMQCSVDSVRASAITCAQMGVEPNGRDAHLIPYGTECTLIIDYKGLIKLAMQSGEISNIHADVICENDVFEYNKGQILAHKVDFKIPRGKVYAVYAMANFKDGSEKSEVMHLDDVQSIRNRSKAKNSGPWVTDFNEMAKKTALRRLSKWLPLSPDIHDRITAEDSGMFEDKSAGSSMPKPAFMDTADDDDDIPMDDIPNVTPEEKKPAPKPKKTRKPKSLFPNPHGQLQRILKLADADGVAEKQLVAFFEDREIDTGDIEVCVKIADGWSGLSADIKEEFPV